MKWMRCQAREVLTRERCPDELNIKAPAFYGRLGVFVTLVKGRKVRGCFGAFDHASVTFENVVREYLHGALRCDPRYEPLDIGELEAADFIVTVAERPVPVSDIESVDISRYGVLLTREDQSSIVFVPAEVRTVDYLKAAIRKERITQISSFRAITITDKRGGS